MLKLYLYYRFLLSCGLRQKWSFIKYFNLKLINLFLPRCIWPVWKYIFLLIEELIFYKIFKVICFFKEGKAVSATIVCGILLYSGLLEVPEDGLQLFAVKRCPPNMRASELRYLYYLSNIVRDPPMYPHYKPITLVSFQMQPVPLFTKIRLVKSIVCNIFLPQKILTYLLFI